MSTKYYIQNMFWGYFITSGVFYSLWDVEKDYKLIVLYISAISAALYPFAKFLIEKTMTNRTGKEFWQKGLFKDGVPKTKMMLFHYSFCLLLSIPLGITCIIIELKKQPLKK